ncbi:MAG: hypothetical protein B0D92_05130 [Spirochaeta sp. LUC14_002_19_P3]|nr:MAG: hypothetical protein B0D92_05130 [Spirochaeta sp. LUC14_002_19_P3]
MPIVPTVHNAGSLNIDDVFRTHHIVRPGETVSSLSLARHVGGKGLNQSIALARSGTPVRHIGLIGEDGIFLKDRLRSEGVDVSGIRIGRDPTGHAIIQVADSGENAIVLFGGANIAWNSESLNCLLQGCNPGDIVLFQNEINMMPELINAAADAGMRLAFNPAPMAPNVKNYPIERVSWLIVNEIEGRELSGCAVNDSSDEADEAVAYTLQRLYPQAVVILTLGKKGAIRADTSGLIRAHFPNAAPVADTTSAGDAFIGYFLNAEIHGLSAKNGLLRSCAAGAITVTRPGAATSIPRAAEVDALCSSINI